AGKFTGAYVTFGRFADVWKPTENAATSARVGLQTYWAVNAEDMATIGGAAAGAIEIKPDGTFQVDVPVSAVNPKDPGTGNYGIYTYPGGGAKYAAFETYTSLAFADPTPQPEPDVVTTTTLAVSDAAVTAGGSVSLTATVAPATASGTVTFYEGSTALGDAVPVKDGIAASSATLATVGAAKLSARFAPAAGFAASTSPVVTVTVSSVVVPPVTPTEKGSLTWGIDADFRAYVTGPIASGSVTPGTGATGAGGAFRFAQSGGSFTAATGRGTAEYAGSVRFTGHAGALDLTFSDPILRVTSATAGVLTLSVNGARVDFGTVNLKAAKRTTVKGATVFTDAPVTLTAAGAAAFDGFYPAGRSLSPLTAVIGAATVTPEPPTDPVATTTTLSASQKSVTAGASVTLTAKVAPTKATGFVTFYTGGKAIGTPVAISSGSAKTAVKPSTVGAHTFTARFAPASGAAFAASTSSAVTVTVTGAVAPPVAPTAPPASDPTSTGSLRWGIDSAFSSYVTGPIAHGAIAVSGGATAAGGAFQFGQSGGSFDQAAGTGSADYSGAVRFTGHAGALDLTFSNPVLRVTDAASGVLSVSVNGSRVDFATVDLGAASRSSAGGATTFTAAPVTLTAAGATAFNGFYSAGRSLAPLTAVIGAQGAAPAGTGGTVASAPAAAAASVTDIPATPPATTGIELDETTLASLVNGDEVTITVGGFEPNETGITVVIYSTPTVLARDLTADASGVVTWTGTLPAALTGTHTLTFQGSTAKGIVLTIPERASVAGQCTVADATLSWGFKESFRGYLTGGIANGDWALTGVTEENGIFGWAGGTGSVDPAASRGSVGYPGTIEFTGHEGALDTTIANPRIELTGPAEGYLLLDVTGTTQQGEPVTAAGIRFAALDLSGDVLTTTDAALTGTAIPAVLTEEGAAAFGTYPAGEALDPVSFTAPLPADCGVAASTADEPVAEAADGDAAAAPAADVEPVSDSSWWIWAVVALLVLAAVAVAVILRRRAVVAARAGKQ
ncbi:MAG: HtaA domain-containing protein, partial [Leifsonia flava]